ncbi:MAG: histidinol-phosphatase [Pseudomonadota bacterium]
MSDTFDLAALASLAGRLADAAGAAALPHFRAANLATDDKDQTGGFDPVTAGDREAEAAMRAVLRKERPDDGVFGEEEARTFGTSGLTWILDPIDGTRAFISGLPVWGTLIALDDGARGRIGVIDQPHIGERFMGVLGADTARASLTHNGNETPITTRQGVRLADATVFTTDPYLFNARESALFDTIRGRARLTRYGVDCYAYALLAMGQVDLVVETDLAAYDIASHVPLITAAGGIVTDWSGGDCRWGGRAVAAGSAALHAEALEILSTI